MTLGALTAARDARLGVDLGGPSGGIPMAWSSQLLGRADIVRDVDAPMGA